VEANSVRTGEREGGEAGERMLSEGGRKASDSFLHRCVCLVVAIALVPGAGAGLTGRGGGRTRGQNPIGLIRKRLSAWTTGVVCPRALSTLRAAATGGKPKTQRTALGMEVDPER